MPTHTFPCPFCGRRMGVETTLLGRNVRCPHCKQVVLAPAPSADTSTDAGVMTPAPPAPRPKQPPIAPNPPPARPEEGPAFKVTGRESADSILGDPNESEDEVFSSSPGPLLPRTDVLGAELLPPQSEDPAPAARDTIAPRGAPTQPGAPRSSPTPQPIAYANPFEDLGGVTSGPRKPHDSQADTFDGLGATAVPTARGAPRPQPKPAVPPPAPAAPPPAPAVPPNPSAGFDEMVASPPPAVSPPAADELPPEPEPVPRRTRSSSRNLLPGSTPAAAQVATNGLFKVGFFLLLAYALLMTVLAVYGLFFKSGKIDPGHPLSTIPDNFGEFPPAERKKVGKYSFPVNGPLPADLKVALGNTLHVGALEVEPLRVVARGLRLVTVAKAGNERIESPPTAPALVLRMRVRNTSNDLTLYPMDPAFTRKAHAGDQTATGLEVGKDTFWGGAIDWPPRNARIGREFELAQEADAAPLKPGESREYVVFTDARREIVKAVREADGPLLWRVQVRRGLIAFRGKDVPVTAIIGVEFKSQDVQSVE